MAKSDPVYFLAGALGGTLYIGAINDLIRRVCGHRMGLADGFTKYTPAAGIPELRQAVADKFKRDNNLSYKPSQIIVSCGGKHSCFNVIFATCEEGGNRHALIEHYDRRVARTFAAHLAACAQLYDPAVFGEGWEREIAVLRESAGAFARASQAPLEFLTRHRPI